MIDVTAIRAGRLGTAAPLGVVDERFEVTMAIKASAKASDRSKADASAITSLTAICKSNAFFMRKKLRHDGDTRKIASWP